MTEAQPKGWWQSFYTDTMADMCLVRSDPLALEETCQFLAARLNIRSGTTVFDQCCGIGSLSLPLAQSGARVIGVDQSESYIQRATQNAASLHAPAQFICGDAFEFVPDRPCDAAFNWNSGFGNADGDEQNLAMIRRAFEGLQPGGRFLLDYQNTPGVLRGFKPCMVRRHPAGESEILLLRECSVNLPEGKMQQLWTYVFPDGRRVTARSSLRLYLPHVIAEMFSACGFTGITFYGNVRGEELSIDSPRCICLGTKP